MEEEYIDDVRDNVDHILISDAIQDILFTELTERERYVIYMRFWDGNTLAQAGKRLRICGQRVRQIEAKALRKLRHFTRWPKWKKIVPDYLEQFARSEKVREMELELYFENKRKEDEERRDKYERDLRERKERQRAMHITCMEALGFPRIPDILKESPPEVKPRASVCCPSIVILKFFPNGEAYLSTAPTHGYSADIKRERDPETYDRWLEQRLKEHTA